MFRELRETSGQQRPQPSNHPLGASNLFMKYEGYKSKSGGGTPIKKMDPLIIQQQREQIANDKMENQLEKIGPAAEGAAVVNSQDENSTVTQNSLIE